MANFEVPVTEYMTTPVETVRVGESLIAANELFAAQGVSALGVVDDEDLLRA
jgi:CBS domain-containing protein